MFGLLRGTFHQLRYRLLTGGRVRIRFPFFVYGPICISGPGTVRIGRHCSVRRNVHDGLHVSTLSPDAHVEIGERCNLGGLHVRARREIVLGARTMTAYCLLQDSFFFSRAPSRREVRAGATSRSIVVGGNAWLGLFSTVLNGSRIGRNSVVSAHALCYGAEIPGDHVAGGNPTRRPLPSESLLRLAERT